MKLLLALLILLLVGIAVFLGNVEFFSAAPGTISGSSDPAGWDVIFDSGHSKLLGRETIRIIVLSKKTFTGKSDGRKLEIAGHILGGRGRIYLLDETGSLTETNAPIFDELWSQRENFQSRVEAWNKSDLRKHWIREYLRASLKPESLDPALRDFIGPAEKSP